MRRFFVLILLMLTLCVPVRAAALPESDREYCIRQVASAYPDIGFGGRVGICTVILHRMDDAGFPDTAASVIDSFGGGCFADLHEPDEKTLRLTRDALTLALDGSDVTGGALYFTVLDDGSPVYDLKFDNSGEKLRAYSVEQASGTCTAVIDGIGFWKQKNPAAAE